MANGPDQNKTKQAKKIADRYINSPYNSIEESFLKVFRWLSSLIDKVFATKYTFIFALVLALAAYISTNYNDTSSTLSSSKVLSNVALSARYNAGTFELSGLPSNCEVVLIGDGGNVTTAASKKGYCQVDLEGLTEGSHTVKVKAFGYGDDVNTIITPSEVNIVLKKKTTMQFDLSYDYINQNVLDPKYILSEPTFKTSSKINIRASSDTLNSISLVKALIDVSGQTADFDIDAPLVAYDKKGNKVDAEIVPSSVTCSIKVSSPSREVPIVLNPIGTPLASIAIDTVEIVDHQTAVMYGPEDTLNKINELKVNFDLSTITDNIEKQSMLPLSIPAGVNSIDISAVNVKVTFAEIEEKTIKDISLNVKENYNNLAISQIDNSSVSVTLKGSANNINKVKPEDIEVYFLMPEAVGTYTLPLSITLNNNPYVNITCDTTSINLTVVESN